MESLGGKVPAQEIRKMTDTEWKKLTGILDNHMVSIEKLVEGLGMIMKLIKMLEERIEALEGPTGEKEASH
jgi:hypothetical protein